MGAVGAKPRWCSCGRSCRSSDDDRSQLLTAFMAARMDGDDYGELMVYEMPSGELPDGPGIAAATIGADETVSELETVLGRGRLGGALRQHAARPDRQRAALRAAVLRGARGRDAPAPQLQRVIAVFGDEVVIEDTLAEALTDLFGESVETQEQPEDGAAPTEGEARAARKRRRAPPSERAAVLLAEAEALFGQADDALAEGDIGAYQEKTNDGRAKVEEAVDLLTGAEAASEADAADPEADAGTDSGGADPNADPDAGGGTAEANGGGARPAPRPSRTGPRPAAVPAPGATRGGIRHHRHAPARPQILTPAVVAVRSWSSGGRLLCCHSPNGAGWSSLVARRAHNPKVAGSNPAPATI